ncbi:hypothetical protein LINGRAPRIM_LOCUS2513 [Linum grandiflorum]
MEEKTSIPNTWNKNPKNLFGRSDDWYVADSDSEDVAEAMREEDDIAEEEDFDPLCPDILFMAEEKASFRCEWRSS